MEIVQELPGCYNSARERALVLFDLGLRPAEVARMLSLRATTSFRYFQQWKRLPPLFTVKYRLARTLFRRIGSDGRNTIATVLAAELGTSGEEVLAQMRKPWSIKQIITGDWRHWPVRRTGVRPTSKLRAWLLLHLSGGLAKEARYIIEMALQGHEILKRDHHDHLS